jgi:predicted  nucleic acid-binding Zn-ribbon protein
MEQECQYCGCVFDSDDSINCPNCGSYSTRTLKSDDTLSIEE